MSHAKVLVLGDEYGALLAPYDEHLDVDPYWDDIGSHYLAFAAEHLFADLTVDSPTEKWRDHLVARDIEDLGTLDNLASPSERSEHSARVEQARAGYRIHEGRLQERRYDNPQGRWDWYVLGGRWSNDLQLKAGRHGKGERGSDFGNPVPVISGRCDRAQKGDLDIEAMRRAGFDAARDRWGTFEQLRTEHGDWRTFRELVDAEGTEAARRLYNAQPIVAAARTRLGLWENLESAFPLDMSGADYCERARLESVPGFATLSDHGWWETGRLGMWGTHTSEGPAAEMDYLQRANDLIDNAAEDTWLSVVDIHS